MSVARSVSERTLVLLVAAVQFINLLDFVMVMPMGPDFAHALGIPASNLGFIGGAYTAAMLPAMRGHLGARREQPTFAQLFQKPNVLLSWAMTFIVMMGGFLLIPNISTYLQENLGYPRSVLGMLYLVGGVVSFFATQLAGRAVDAFGSFRSGTLGTIFLGVATYCGYVMVPPPWPVRRELSSRAAQPSDSMSGFAVAAPGLPRPATGEPS